MGESVTLYFTQHGQSRELNHVYAAGLLTKRMEREALRLH
jgi:hypothetical protein